MSGEVEDIERRIRWKVRHAQGHLGDQGTSEETAPPH
jgi:hypothetical protein